MYEISKSRKTRTQYHHHILYIPSTYKIEEAISSSPITGKCDLVLHRPPQFAHRTVRNHMNELDICSKN